MKVSSIGVHIKCKDLEASIRFYERIGLKASFSYGSPLHLSRYQGISTVSEGYDGVVYTIGDGLLEIANGHVAVRDEVFKEDVKSSKISIMIDTESVNEVRDIATIEGFDIASDIKEYHWGSRELVLRDPDGVIVVFREMI